MIVDIARSWEGQYTTPNRYPNMIKQRSVEELVEVAQYHDRACYRERAPFNWDNPLCRKNYSFNREIAFEARRKAREKLSESNKELA